jgi:hypothetical protein
MISHGEVRGAHKFWSLIIHSVSFSFITELSKDDERCHNCHELCMQALNKVDELKISDTTNGLLAPQKEFSSKDDHHASSSISSASSSHIAKSINSHGAAPLGVLKCKEDENSMKKLNSAEIEILKLTSNVNAKLFLPWVDESDLREKFTYDDLFMYVELLGSTQHGIWNG